MLRLQLLGSEYDSVSAPLSPLIAVGLFSIAPLMQAQRIESTGSTAVPPETVELADVRAYLSGLSEALQNTVTVFDEESFGFTPAAIDADWRALAPTDDAVASRRVMTYFCVGKRRALLRFDEGDVADPEDCSQAPRMACWTGTEWYDTELATHKKTQQTSRTHTFSPTPRGSAGEYMVVFNLTDNWPSFLSTYDLASFIQPSLFKSRDVDGEEVRFTFAASEKSDSATIELALSTEPALRLEAVTFTFGRGPLGRKVVRIDEWQPFGNSLIPKVATYFDGRIDDKDGDGATSAFTRRMTRQSIRRVEPGSADTCLGPIPFAHGDHVLDSCYGLRYRIGYAVLFADHLRIDLDQPVQTRVTKQLSELVGAIEKIGDGRFRRKDG